MFNTLDEWEEVKINNPGAPSKSHREES